MDSTSYGAVLVALFVVMIVIVGMRLYVGKRLDRIEKQKQQERDARTTSESNSGL
jgi:Tfp pilus assembly protein PilO